MTTERTKGQNSVQAKHHQLIPAEEMIRALQTGRDIGYNDLAAYIVVRSIPMLHRVWSTH